jgi:hypothetical protein
LQPEKGGTLVASEGQVRGNAIGVCVTDPAFDLAQVSDRVDYLENTTRLDSRVLALPSSLPAL